MEMESRRKTYRRSLVLHLRRFIEKHTAIDSISDENLHHEFILDAPREGSNIFRAIFNDDEIVLSEVIINIRNQYTLIVKGWGWCILKITNASSSTYSA